MSSGRVDEHFAGRVPGLDGASSPEQGGVERSATGDEQIDLDGAVHVDDIDRRAALDGPEGGQPVDVERRRQQVGQAQRLVSCEIDDEIDVERRAGLTRIRAGERAADRVGSAQRLECIDHHSRDSDRFGHDDRSSCATSG
jgi:hypothetical protein